MKRRQLLSAAPFAAAVIAAPALAESEEAAQETPVEALYRQWEAVTELADAHNNDDMMPDEDFEAITQRQTDIEDAIAITPAQNLRDFAMKVYARPTRGICELPRPSHNPEFWAEDFVVAAGSKARVRTTRTIPRGTVTLRNTLIEKGVLREEGDFLIFTSDYSFTSASAAAATVIGASANGRILWKLPDGRTYADWETSQDVSNGTCG